MRISAFIIVVAINIKAFDCIVRGHDAKVNQFPYVARMVLRSKEESYMCGAALIGNGWLLTAAHCFTDVISVELYLGSIFTHVSGKKYNVPLSSITVHPNFDGAAYINDIALVKIPLTFLSKGIAIVRLPKLGRPRAPYGKAYAQMCGWGHKRTHGELATRLQYGRLQVLDSKDCRFSIIEIIRKNVMCTAVRPDLASPCLGDSGGPLVLETTGELIGISSIGDQTNCEDGYTPLYTRVASYLHWIKFVSGISY